MVHILSGRPAGKPDQMAPIHAAVPGLLLAAWLALPVAGRSYVHGRARDGEYSPSCSIRPKMHFRVLSSVSHCATLRLLRDCDACTAIVQSCSKVPSDLAVRERLSAVWRSR